jgi:hypothetical protein
MRTEDTTQWDLPTPQLITRDGVPWAVNVFGTTVPITAFADAIRRSIETDAQREVDRWAARFELARELIAANYGAVIDAQVFPLGKTVIWHAQGSGRALVKMGVIVAYIPPGAALSLVLPEGVTKGQCEGEETNSRARYLVRVSRTQKRTGDPLPPWYYTPIASVINRRNVNRPDT